MESGHTEGFSVRSGNPPRKFRALHVVEPDPQIPLYICAKPVDRVFVVMDVDAPDKPLGIVLTRAEKPLPSG